MNSRHHQFYNSDSHCCSGNRTSSCHILHTQDYLPSFYYHHQPPNPSSHHYRHLSPPPSHHHRHPSLSVRHQKHTSSPSSHHRHSSPSSHHHRHPPSPLVHCHRRISPPPPHHHRRPSSPPSHHHNYHYLRLQAKSHHHSLHHHQPPPPLSPLCMMHRSLNKDDMSYPQYEHSQGTYDDRMTYSEPSHLMKNNVHFKYNSLQPPISPQDPHEIQTGIAVDSEEDTSSTIMTRSKSKKQSKFKKQCLNKDVNKENSCVGSANEVTISSDANKVEDIPSTSTSDVPVPEATTVRIYAVPPVAVVEPIPLPDNCEAVVTTEMNVVSGAAEPLLKLSTKSDKSHVQLRKWRVVFVKKDVTIVEGYKDDDMKNLWHSGPIVKRLSSRELLTKSGSLYKLVGPLNSDNLSEDIAAAFQDGFPEDWVMLANSYLDEEKRVSDINKESALPSESVAVTPNEPSLDTDKETIVETKDIKEETDVTPSVSFKSSYEEQFLSSLKRSSRGRLIKPVLHNVISMDSLTASNSYSYNRYGEFQGLNSSTVIDLTSDDSLAEKFNNSFSGKLTIVEDLGSTRGKKHTKRLTKVEKLKFEEETASNHEESQHGDISLKSFSIKLDKGSIASRLRSKTGSVNTSQNEKATSVNVTNGMYPKLKTCTSDSVKGSKTVVQKKKVGRPPKSSDSQSSKLSGDKPSKSKVDQPPKSSGSQPSKSKVNQPLKSKITRRRKNICFPKKLSKHRNDDKSTVVAMKAMIAGSEENDYTAIDWSENQLKRLKSVVHSVSALSEDFWGDVAHKMGKRFTPEDCRHQYLQFGGNPTSHSHKRNDRNERRDDYNNTGSRVITGRTGTLKRKRELRNVLEHMDDDYIDDGFESTPMQKRWKHIEGRFYDSYYPNGVESSSSSDDDDRQEQERRYHIRQQQYCSPLSYKHSLGASISATPSHSQDEYYSQSELDMDKKRRNADIIVYRYQKTKDLKGRKPKLSVKPIQSNSPLIGMKSNQMRDAKRYKLPRFKIFEDCDDSENEEEGESNDSLSDLEEQYQQIMKHLQ